LTEVYCRNILLSFSTFALLTRKEQVTHDITESCMKVLEMVARSRETGVTQVQLRDALNTDSKNVFHFVKQINLAGYVYCIAFPEIECSWNELN